MTHFLRAVPSIAPTRLLGAALAALLLSLPAFPALAAQDEVVPAGVWRVQVEMTVRTEDMGFDGGSNEGPLLNYLVPNATVLANLAGSVVVREYQRTDLLVGYGLSDTWNLVFQVPWVSIKQVSTIVNGGGGDPDTDAAAARLASREISGLGALRLGLLNRPVFRDAHTFSYGFGVVHPLEAPASPWAGRGTLLLDIPYTRLYGNLHYSYLPLGTHSRLDIRSELGIAVTEKLEQDSGGTANVVPGNDLTVYAGWGSEWGPMSTEAGLRLFRQARSEISGAGQNDTISETAFHLGAGIGNLHRLEQEALSFPWQVDFTLEATLSGSSTPTRVEARVGLKFYF